MAIHLHDLRLAIDLLLREEPGINVMAVVSDAEGLLGLLRTAQPHVVLLDKDLPGSPLEEMLANIRAAASQPKIIVLGHEEDDRDITLAAGADALVVKGESPEALLAAIREATSKSKKT